MKLNGENIKIGPMDMNKEGPISRGRECTRFDLIKVKVVKIFIDRILEDGVSYEEKQQEAEKLRSKITMLLENNNTLLLICAEKIAQNEKLTPENIASKLDLLVKQLISGDKEAGQKILDIFETYDFFQKNAYDFSSERIPELKTLFIEKIKSFSDDSGLDIDMEKVKNMVDHTRFIFHDKSFLKNGGGHNSSNEIYLNIDQLLYLGVNYVHDFLIHGSFHELLHSISKDWAHIISHRDDSQLTYAQSGGVGFSGNFNREKERGFVWLNEAFTETFSIFIANTYDKGIYSEERRLLDLLKQKGKIDLILKLSKLYFRHTLKNKEINPTEEWRNFSKEVDSVFGPRFLVKLDIFIEKCGIKKAIEIIEKWEDGKPFPEELK